MISEEDVAQIVYDAMKGSRESRKDFRKEIERQAQRQGKWGVPLKKPFNLAYTSLPAKKIFLSEHDIKQRLGKEKVLKVPREAILSPLAAEWISLKGIQIVREP